MPYPGELEKRYARPPGTTLDTSEVLCLALFQVSTSPATHEHDILKMAELPTARRDKALGMPERRTKGADICGSSKCSTNHGISSCRSIPRLYNLILSHLLISASMEAYQAYQTPLSRSIHQKFSYLTLTYLSCQSLCEQGNVPFVFPGR